MDLSDRMKMYEHSFRQFLPRRFPVVIRLDGKAFHTLTKKLKMEKPFDIKMKDLMTLTTLNAIGEIQNAKMVYIQSDEISILMHDLDTFNTEPWFGNNIQKMVSVSAALISSYFNINLKQLGYEVSSPALFDSRVFILSEEEICNYFIWRQQDAVRNSIQGLGQKTIGKKKINGMSNNKVQEELFTQCGINWNDYPIWTKRGWCIVKQEEKPYWVIDYKIPNFTQDRKYIENKVFPAKEKT